MVNLVLVKTILKIERVIIRQINMFRQYRYLVIFFFCCLCALNKLNAQEINAKVNVVYAQIGSTVDKKVFQTLQTALNAFLNKRKWTSDLFEPHEKIECSFLLNLQSVVEPNVYKGTLTIQAARPVYNTNYLSPLVNHIDNNIVFRYVEFQPIEFNENRVSGTEPLAGNLTALFSFYINIILGLDYDAFAPRGGDAFFQKSNAIVSSSPEGRYIEGWKPFDGQRNRYWLSENLQNSRYALAHDAIYTYYRQGMDKMIENEKDAREQVMNAISMLNSLNAETPNLMIMPFFFQGKTDEVIRLFKKGNLQEKARVIDLCTRLDISNASKYRQELK